VGRYRSKNVPTAYKKIDTAFWTKYKHTQPGIFAYYRKKHKGRDLYIVIYGDFSKRADAEKTAGHFTPLKPWIREFGSIQEIMLKK